MARNADERTEAILGKLLPVICERLHQSTPGLAICSQLSFGVGEAVLKDDGGAIVERMGERRFTMYPLETVVVERKLREEGRARGHWMPGRVSGIVRAAPPGSASASNTSTCRPAWARTMAAARPLGPDPITQALFIASFSTV